MRDYRTSPLVRGTVALGLTLAPAVTALGADDAAQASVDLRSQVQALQEKVRDLEARQSGPSQADTNRIIESVLRDAEQRSRLLSTETPLLAGHEDGKFFIRSEDGSFSFKPSIYGQFRNVTNFAENAKDDGTDNFQNGFELRRLWLRAEGTAFTKDLSYYVAWEADRNANSMNLLDAYMTYRFAPQWAVKGGQWKEAGFHEKDTPDSNQLAVERSLADSLLGGGLTDRVQGVALIYGGTKDDAIRAELAVHDGANTKNTDFRDGTAKFGVGGRFEYKALGDWASYRDFSAKGTKSDLLVFGGGFDYTDRDTRSGTLFTADAQYENPNGLGVYAALQGNYFDERADTAASDSRFNWGGLVQAGYLFNPNVEGFARYALVVLDDDFVADNQFSEITVGANYFFGKDGAFLHRLKLTVDMTYLPNGAPQDITGEGIIQSDGAEYLLRAQLTVQL